MMHAQVLFVSLLVVCASAAGVFNERQLIARVNAANTTWRAGYNRRWTRVPYHLLRQSLGVHLGRHAARLRSAPRNHLLMDAGMLLRRGYCLSRRRAHPGHVRRTRCVAVLSVAEGGARPVGVRLVLGVRRRRDDD